MNAGGSCGVHGQHLYDFMLRAHSNDLCRIGGALIASTFKKNSRRTLRVWQDRTGDEPAG